MTVSPMEMSYPNDHLEGHEGYGNLTKPDKGLELTDHVSIPTVSMSEKILPRYHSYSFYDEGPSINPKADT